MSYVDYAPPHVRHAERVIELFRNEPESLVEAFVPPRIDPLDDLALIMRRLTYGQMIELASGLDVPADAIHKWSHARAKTAKEGK